MEEELNNNDKFYVERVAHFLKSKRRNLKLTQQQMADQFEIDSNQIWRMELGKKTTKLSTALRVIDEFSKKSGMTPNQFVSYLLKIPATEESANLSSNEIALLKAFRSAPAELRREYAQLSRVSETKFALSLEVQKYPVPIIKKLLELLKVTTAK